MILLTLALSVLSPSAQASDPATLAATSAQLVASAAHDVAYLGQNTGNCTRFASAIQSQLIGPIAQDLQNFQARLARYSDAPEHACGSRADLDFIIGTIDGKLTLANSPQRRLMGMSGDQAMTKALSAGYGFPNCRAENPQDPRSTPELKAYFTAKLKLISLKTAVASLKNITDCEKQEN